MPSNDPDRLLQQATVQQQRGDLTGAMASARRLLARCPGHAKGQHMMGALLLQDGRPRDAIAYLRGAAAAEEGSGALVNLGIALFQDGQAEEAEAVLASAATAQPDNPHLAYNLGHLLQTVGRPGEAEVWLQRATQLAPGYLRAWCELGAVQVDLGNDARARASFETALTLEPEHPIALYDLALLELDCARFADAEARFAGCHPSLGSTRGMVLGWGLCLQELGRGDEAFVLYRDLLARDRDAYPLVLRNLTSVSKGLFDIRPSRIRALLGVANRTPLDS